MPSIVLTRHAQPLPANEQNYLDTNKPLDYRAWLNFNKGINSNDAEQQYQQYLLRWANNKSQVSTVALNTIKADYIALLKKLQVLFQNDEEFTRIAAIDFDDPLQVQLSIPLFASKLKDIALYYASKREYLKKAKIRYTNIGSFTGLERALYNTILSEFAGSDATPYPYKFSSPTTYITLSAISNNFQIEVQEIADMHNYYADTTPQPLASDNPLTFVLDEYLLSLYGTADTASIPLSAFSNPIDIDIDSRLNANIASRLTEKYLGTSVYYMTGGIYEYPIVPVDIDLLQGNTFFYWFSGKNVSEIPEGIYKDIPINELDWTYATGASALNLADVIFTTAGNVETKGAWLSDTSSILVSDTMSATMKDNTEFIFAYPGKGYIDDSNQWIGPFTSDKPTDDLFSNAGDNKLIAINYWNTVPDISSVQPILLQNTSLISDGARVSNRFQYADKLYKNNEEVSWAYNFPHTQLPIKTGSSNLYYPLTAYKNIDDLFFRYESGDTISLSSVKVEQSFSGAIAGLNLDTADTIIKVDGVCGKELELAWLKGESLAGLYDTPICSCENANLVNYNTEWFILSGVSQPALTLHVEPGEYARFIWTGPKSKLNDLRAFKGFEHDASCEYLKQKHKSLLSNDFLQKDNQTWNTCTCKSVNHSPLGHGGDSIDSLNVLPDFIYLDTVFPNDFNKHTWKGSDNRDYKSSSDIAWFKTSNPDLNWYTGTWTTKDNNEFVLETGKTYVYYRSDLGRCTALPNLIISQPYTNPSTYWAKATKDNNGNWIEQTIPTDMLLEAGSFLKYKHGASSNIILNRLQYNNQYITTLSGSYVSLSAYDPLISYDSQTISTPAINFLIKIPLSNNDGYWASADFFKQNGGQLAGSDNMRITYDYLQITQPPASPMILNNADIIRYNRPDCADCFTWKQPLTYEVVNPIREWKQLLIDNCVESEILNYLQSQTDISCASQVTSCYSVCPIDNICGCDNHCYSTKVGITATDIPSDIIFNTELSGIPLYISYKAQKDFRVSLSAIDITEGKLYIPPATGVYITASEPWGNLFNTSQPYYAVSAVHTDLYTRPQLGLINDTNISNGKFELRDGVYDIQGVNSSSQDMTLYTDHLGKVVNSRAQWMKKPDGNVVVNGRQTYYPYTSNIDTNSNINLGLWDIRQDFTPWSTSSKWKYDSTYIDSATGLHPIDYWYTDQLPLSGHVRNWETDIFGNQYFLMFADNTPKIQKPTGYGELYIKIPNGTIYNSTSLLSAFYNRFSNIRLGTSSGSSIDIVDGLQTEEGYYITTEDGVIISIG